MNFIIIFVRNELHCSFQNRDRKKQNNCIYIQAQNMVIYFLSIQQNMTWIITEIQDVQWAIIYDLEDIHNEA